MRVRQGIFLERVDTEKARLARTARALQLAADATDKFWAKLRRKIEAEYLDEAHQCQWKLGVAHEGFFPGRRRVVLRPRFDVTGDAVLGGVRARPGDGQDSPLAAAGAGVSPRTGGRLSLGASVDDSEGGLIDIDDVSSPEASERLKIALARSLAGHILDVTSKEAVDAAADGHDLSADLLGAAPKAAAPAGAKKGTSTSSSSAAVAAAAPGTGWGLVDADGSEEGFGVVGLEPTMVDVLDSDRFTDFDAAPPPLGAGVGVGVGAADGGKDGTQPAPGAKGAAKPPADARAPPTAAAGGSVAGDHMGDVRLVEDALREGRGAVETGPQFSGTKKLGGGGVIQKCRVIMVTASGNFWGTLSFNTREIFFASSLEPEDGHKEDSAAVNLVPQVSFAVICHPNTWCLSSQSRAPLRHSLLHPSCACAAAGGRSRP